LEINALTEEQSDIVFQFIDKLFSNDVEGYWKLISKVDQARIYGMYKAFAKYNQYNEISFYDYVKDYFKSKQSKNYERVKDNTGISTTLRHTEEGEIQVFLLENVQAARIYTTEVQERVFPVILTIDTNVVNGEIIAEWKVRIYIDQFYKYLNKDEIPKYE